eukprot:TRINITY_DN64510_c0_g1_i1.p1 TRINITY_DN64510_c0_g1~~TRINITY_DN64510_c0_g1_i1.p1  ORF type:complete len:604 (-),score=123.03 TRINITY_DN64510_c0_g1_i1:101-1912(-)
MAEGTPVAQTASAAAPEQEETAGTNNIPLGMPPVRRLRVCLLGGDVPVKGVGKTDVAAALLRGLTADQPGDADPMLDLAFDHGAFERAWSELLADASPQPLAADSVDGPVTAGGGPGSEAAPNGAGADAAQQVDFDRWGTGPLSAWDGRLRFDRRGGTRGNEGPPPYDADPVEECASVCAGHADKLNLGTKRIAGVSKAFRDILTPAGQDVDAYEKINKELYALAEAKPRELVWRNQPCTGVLGSFARFSPEIGGFSGCGAAMLHIFEPGSRPFGSQHNVAMLYAAPPSSKLHQGLTPAQFLCALRAAGSNLARAVREYNRLAVSQVATEAWERAMWFQADLRAQVECLLSDRNVRTDFFFQERLIYANDGWIDLQYVKGRHRQGLRDAELLDALTASQCLETRVAEDGRVFVRRKGGKPPAFMEAVLSAKRKYQQMKQEYDSDPVCWDIKRRGFCPRGASCKYEHPPGMGFTAPAPTETPLPPEVPVPVAEGATDAQTIQQQAANAVSEKQEDETSAKCAELLGLSESTAAPTMVPPPNAPDGPATVAPPSSKVLGADGEPAAKVAKGESAADVAKAAALLEASVEEVAAKSAARKKRFEGW